MRLVPEDPSQLEFPFHPWACATCNGERKGVDCFVKACGEYEIVKPPPPEPPGGQPAPMRTAA